MGGSHNSGNRIFEDSHRTVRIVGITAGGAILGKSGQSGNDDFGDFPGITVRLGQRNEDPPAFQFLPVEAFGIKPGLQGFIVNRDAGADLGILAPDHGLLEKSKGVL